MIKRSSLIWLVWVLAAYAANPLVENVRMEQRTDGSLMVDIYYDVSDVDGDTLEIKIQASNDNGLTWTLPCAGVSGDVGSGVLSGKNKHIVWNFYADNPNVSGAGYRVRILADDSGDDCIDIDGNVYKTIRIGNQLWMAENLKVTRYRNGDPILNVIVGSEWAGLTTGAYCDYGNNPSNADVYGRLYNWHAVNDNRNLAPTGWHVPTDEEWKQLEMALGMNLSQVDVTGWRGTDEGGKMKEAGTAHWAAPNTGATNESGFTGLPGGYRNFNGSSLNLGNYASFWSSTEYSYDLSWSRYLFYDYSTIRRLESYKVAGFSLRCVKDEDTCIDIDGNVYKTVKIGNQLWMAENLKVTRYRNGDPIPNVTETNQWAGLDTGAYCDYNNTPANSAVYGRLYNWHAVKDSRNLAPAGWHVPTDEEWKQLEMALGMSRFEADENGWRGTTEGGKMKEMGTSHWLSPNTGATNESGFTALPGGFRYYPGGAYMQLCDSATFWSSTENGGLAAWARVLSYLYSNVHRSWGSYKRCGFSVRCVRD